MARVVLTAALRELVDGDDRVEVDGASVAAAAAQQRLAFSPRFLDHPSPGLLSRWGQAPRPLLRRDFGAALRLRRRRLELERGCLPPSTRAFGAFRLVAGADRTP